MDVKTELLEKVNYFPINQGGILHLKHPCKFQICGYLQISVYHGMIKVYGYNFNPASNFKFMKLYSSAKFESFIIETSENVNNTAMNSEYLSMHLHKTDIEFLIANLMPNDAIICIQELQLPYKNALPYMSLDLEPVIEGSSTVFPALLKNCKITIEPTLATSSRMLNMATWNNVQPGQINFVQACGGLGKTRFAKYVINKLLNDHEAVLCLDLDVGQNEFVPPGCIALVLIKQPILGQNFSHQPHILRMVNVGYMNATKVLKQYTCGVNELVSFAVQNYCGKYPWVVNTIGLFEELGVGIAQTLIRIVKPTDVLTIKDPTNNLIEDLRPEKLAMEYKFQTVDNGPMEEDPVLRSKDKIWRRSIMVMSYFSSLLKNPFDTFKTIEPYRVELKKLALAVPNVELNKDALRLYMKSLVSLCDRPPFGHCRTVDDINFIINPKVVPCMGLGLVVNINMEKKEFSIISPLSEEEILRTKLIAISLVPVPQQFFCENIHVGFGDRGREYRFINEEHNKLLRSSRENLLRQLKPLTYNKGNDHHNKQQRGNQKRPPYNNSGSNGNANGWQRQNRSPQNNKPINHDNQKRNEANDRENPKSDLKMGQNRNGAGKDIEHVRNGDQTSNVSVAKAVEANNRENDMQNRSDLEVSQNCDGVAENANIAVMRNGPNQRGRGRGRGIRIRYNNRQNTNKMSVIDAKEKIVPDDGTAKVMSKHQKPPLDKNQQHTPVYHNSVVESHSKAAVNTNQARPSQMLPLSAVEMQQMSTVQLQQLLSALLTYQQARSPTQQQQPVNEIERLLSALQLQHQTTVVTKQEPPTEMPKLLSSVEPQCSGSKTQIELPLPGLMQRQPFDRTFNVVCIIIIVSLFSFILGSVNRNSHF